MQNINYIKHLKGVFIQFSKDNNLNPIHISLYMALFQLWNINRFAEVFYVNREEVMQYAKIGSKSTYHRCVKELNHWKYLIYFPSHNPYKGSKIKMLKFETSSGQALVHNRPKSGTSSGQALVSNININKQYINFIKLEAIAKEKLILEFFKKEKYPELEVKKFFNHYQGIGCKVGGKTTMVDWQATAKSWMLKTEEMKLTQKEKSNNFQHNHFQDNLHTKQNKNYDEPL